MSRRKGKIWIGTSGWHYKHWKGTFYPEGLADSKQFDFYKKKFKTVELNNSFYMLPESKTFDGWRKAAPKNFLFSVKMSRFITHMKKLNVGKNDINKFLNRAAHLGEKLGPVLFQLPPRWKKNVERFERLLNILPKGYRYTFEFRDHTWYDEEIYALLRKHSASFCIYELEYHTSPIEVTSDLVYIRLHGPGKKYQGSYNKRTLKKWAERCRKWQKEGRDVFVYFDNDQQGFAARNAIDLSLELGKLGLK